MKRFYAARSIVLWSLGLVALPIACSNPSPLTEIADADVAGDTSVASDSKVGACDATAHDSAAVPTVDADDTPDARAVAQDASMDAGLAADASDACDASVPSDANVDAGAEGCRNNTQCAAGLRCESALDSFYGQPAGTGTCTPPRPSGPLTRVETVAGTGAIGQNDGPAATATFNAPIALVVTPAGDIYVADISNHVTRKISAAGMVTSIPAGGTGVGLGPDGTVYVGSSVTHSVYRLDASDAPVWIAGSGTQGFMNGPAATAQFDHPYGIVVAKNGTLYVADKYNARIRSIAPDGTVGTFVGLPVGGFTDGSPSVAQFNYPEGLSLDPAGNLYVGDKYNHAVRRVTPAGLVSTIAGTGTLGAGDGVATATPINYALQVTIDPWGTVYFADPGQHALGQITPDGQLLRLTGGYGYVDGPLATAHVAHCNGAFATPDGSVYVADTGNYMVRAFRR